jgi:hypothetical protein
MTFHGRTGLEIRGPVRQVSGPRPTNGKGFFFFRPFQAGCPGLIPGFFIYLFFFSALFRRAVIVDAADENGSQNRQKKRKRGY